MEDVNGKEISLQYVTVKVPGQKPRGSKSIITTVPGYNGYTSVDIHDSIGGLSLGKGNYFTFNINVIAEHIVIRYVCLLQ